MSSKKKIAISISALALIVVAAIVAVVVVFAARSANFGGDFGGGYTAHHVNASITGAYKIGAEVTDEEGWTDLTTSGTSTPNTIEFTDDIGTGDEQATQTFNEVNGLVLTATDNVIFKYTVVNTGESGENFTIVGTQSGSFDNLTVTYKYKEGEGVAQDLSVSADKTTAITVEGGETVTLYVIISITNPDNNASFDGSVNWDLGGVGA